MGSAEQAEGHTHLVAVHLRRGRSSGSLFGLGDSRLALFGRCCLWVLRDGRRRRGVGTADERGIGGLGRLECRLEQLGVCTPCTERGELANSPFFADLELGTARSGAKLRTLAIAKADGEGFGGGIAIGNVGGGAVWEKQ